MTVCGLDVSFSNYSVIIVYNLINIYILQGSVLNKRILNIMRYCLDCKKKASFNTEGLKAIYCVDHKKEDMVNVVSKTCLDCKKQPTFNTEGLKALYCIDHKK